MIETAQIRAARALLGWTQGDLAKKSRTGVVTVCRVERGQQKPTDETMKAFETALTNAGVVFVGKRGLRLD